MVKYGFFNSMEGDRVYSAEDLACMYDGLVSDGVIRGLGAQLEVTACDKMQVLIGTGKAIVGRKWIWNTEQLALTIPPANESSVRLDLIVARADFVNRKVSFEVVKGDDIGSLPKPVDTSTIKEIPLAWLSIPAAATKIKTENIHDSREFATVDNLQNSAVEYKSSKGAVFVSQEAESSATKFYERPDSQVIVNVVQINGNKIVDVTAKNIDIWMEKGKAYEIKPLMPSGELYRIPTNATVVQIYGNGDGQVNYIGPGVDSSDNRTYFGLITHEGSTTGNKIRLSALKISYMLLNKKQKLTY